MTPQQQLAFARAARGHKKIAPLDVSEYKLRLSDIPDHFKHLFKKVWEGTTSRKARIKAKCVDCSCYQRVEVRKCTVKLCPLWPIRPYQGDAEKTEGSK